MNDLFGRERKQACKNGMNPDRLGIYEQRTIDSQNNIEVGVSDNEQNIQAALRDATLGLTRRKECGFPTKNSSHRRIRNFEDLVRELAGHLLACRLLEPSAGLVGLYRSQERARSLSRRDRERTIFSLVPRILFESTLWPDIWPNFFSAASRAR